MSIVIQIRNFAESKGHKTNLTNDMNLLHSWDSTFVYRYKFNNDKLSEISVTDINMNDIKDTVITNYISSVNNRLTHLYDFRDSLRDYIDDNVLSEYVFPPYETEEEYKTLRKNHLMNYMVSSVYDFMYNE